MKTMTLLLLVLLSSFVAFCNADAQVHYLNRIFKDSEYIFKNVEDYADLYVASNDDIDLLRNITVQVGMKTYTLDQFATSTNPDGTQSSLTLIGQVIFSSTLEDSSTASLTGYLYITSAAQSKDPNFSVYVVSNTHEIEINKAENVASTTVVLNTALKMSGNGYPPPKSSRITNITQPTTSTLEILRGIPNLSATTEEKIQRIFMNPLTFQMNETSNTQFFNDIVPMQLDLEYWFIKAVGSFSLIAQRQWDNTRVYYANSLTTTGLIVNEFLFEEINVYFTINPANSRIIGTIASTFLEQDEGMSIIFEDDSGSTNQTNYDVSTPVYQASFTSNLQAVNMTVAATITPGLFYIQYFGIDGSALPVTNSPTTEAFTVPSSTITQPVSTSKATQSVQPSTPTEPVPSSTTTQPVSSSTVSLLNTTLGITTVSELTSKSDSTTATVWTTTKIAPLLNFQISSLSVFIYQFLMHWRM